MAQSDFPPITPMPPLEVPFINTPDPSEPTSPPDTPHPLMPAPVATTTPPVFPTLPPLLPLSVSSSVSSPRHLAWMSSASPSSMLSWATPSGTAQPAFPRSGAFPAWRLDGHELAWAEVSAQTRICRFSLLLDALRQTPCPLSQSFLPIPAIAASLWDAVVAPDGARMAFLRVGLHGERVDVWVQAMNDPQGTTALSLSGGLPSVLYAITPAWSPNGRYLAFAAGSSLGFSIYLHDFQTGTTTPVPGMAGTWVMPFWSSDNGALAAISLTNAAPIQYTLGAAGAVPFAPPAGSVWGQVFVPTLGGGAETYAWLTDYNTASRTFAIQSPNVSADTRGIGLRVECPECGLLLHSVTLSGAWSMDDVRDIAAGVMYTGEALALQFGGRGHEAFRRILVQGVPSIVFQRSTAAGVACNATGFPVIACGANSQPSQYTVVHELGHVFTQWTGGTQVGDTFYGGDAAKHIRQRKPDSHGGDLSIL